MFVNSIIVLVSFTLCKDDKKDKSEYVCFIFAVYDISGPLITGFLEVYSLIDAKFTAVADRRLIR